MNLICSVASWLKDTSLWRVGDASIQIGTQNIQEQVEDKLYPDLEIRLLLFAVHHPRANFWLLSYFLE
jgi:hypothetical protein